MNDLSEQSKADVWESSGAGVESLAQAVEEDGLPYGLAMGELLRSLLTLSQTLSGKRIDGPVG
jgi:hypothetical protein